MTHRRLRTANRVLLGLAGAVLLCAGGIVLARGEGWPVPSWWPYGGPADALLGRAARAHLAGAGWWWPVVIGVLAALLALSVCWLLAQPRRGHLSEVVVESDGAAALVRGGALEDVLTSDTESLEGVASARTVLTGRRASLTARIHLLLEPYAVPGDALRTVTDEALARARDSAGLDRLPAEVRMRAARHRPSRVR